MSSNILPDSSRGESNWQSNSIFGSAHRKDKYPDIRYGIKLCNKNIGFNEKFYTFPYFCVFLLNRYIIETKIQQGMGMNGWCIFETIQGHNISVINPVLFIVYALSSVPLPLEYSIRHWGSFRMIIPLIVTYLILNLFYLILREHFIIGLNASQSFYHLHAGNLTFAEWTMVIVERKLINSRVRDGNRNTNIFWGYLV